MGFMDKVKSAAQDVATEAKKATAQGKEKLEDMQTKKKMDEAAKKLGYLVYRERTESVPAGSEADSLIQEMTGLQAQLDAAAAAAPPATSSDAATAAPGTPPVTPPQPTSSEPSSGDFKL
ncbi:MAG: hypothetical protein ACRDLB_07310 [Actinomycetota bacterium]